jgi:hypothetical protein
MLKDLPMTMWRPPEAVEEDVSDLPGIIRGANVADHAATVGVMGSLTKQSLRLSSMFDPTERSSES